MKAAALIMSGTLFILNASTLFALCAIRSLRTESDLLGFVGVASLILGIFVLVAGATSRSDRRD